MNMPIKNTPPNIPGGSLAGTTDPKAYPDASQIPEANGEADAQKSALGQGTPNPVINALQIVAQYVKSASGSDANSPLVLLFKNFLEEVMNNMQGKMQQPKQPAAPQQPPVPPPVAPIPPNMPGGGSQEPSIGSVGKPMQMHANPNAPAKTFV